MYVSVCVNYKKQRRRKSVLDFKLRFLIKSSLNIQKLLNDYVIPEERILSSINSEKF